MTSYEAWKLEDKISLKLIGRDPMIGKGGAYWGPHYQIVIYLLFSTKHFDFTSKPRVCICDYFIVPGDQAPKLDLSILQIFTILQ